MLGLCWGYIRVILGLCWRYVGVILRLCWGYVGKIGGITLGVPIIRIIVFCGLYWGPLILGNYHIGVILGGIMENQMEKKMENDMETGIIIIGYW